MQTQNHEFTLKQREAFTKLLAQAKDQVQKETALDWSFDSRIKRELAPQFIEKYGANDALRRIQTLMKELDAAKAALRILGFTCDDDGDVSITHDAPKNISDALEEIQSSAKKDRQQTLRKFDLAMVAVLASHDVTEARTIVEELL